MSHYRTGPIFLVCHLKILQKKRDWRTAECKELARLFQFWAHACMHQQKLWATAKLYKLDELSHLHLSHTFTYYRALRFLNFIKLRPILPPFYIFLLTPHWLRFSHGWSWSLQLPRGSNFSQILELDACIPSIHFYLHTCTCSCVLFSIWSSTLPQQRGICV